MIKQQLTHFKIAIKTGLPKMVFLSVFLCNISTSHAQEDEFELLGTEEILHFRYELYAQSIGLFFSYIPPDLLHRRLLITNARTACVVGYEINAITFEHRQALVELCSDWSRSDTLFISLQEGYTGLNYLPQKIIPGITNTEVKLGDNCYKLLCEPENDPWMPNGNKPFLFSLYDYYVNPKNGKAIKGERILNSGRFSACELETWALIYADEIEIYKANLKTKKSQGTKGKN